VIDAAHKLLVETEAAKRLRSRLLELTDDEDTTRDTIEGETNLHEAIRAVLLSIEEDQALVDGIDARMADLTARCSRIALRIEAKRGLIEEAMQAGEIKKLETDIATVSLRAIPPKLIITDEAQIPQNYLIPQPPKIDKASVKDALANSTPVPGAELSNGGVGLTIRRK
jgi:hypothetical protein